MGLNSTREQLLTNMTGWNIYPYDVPSVNFPAAVVGFPEVTFDRDYGKRRIYSVVVRLMVSMADEKSAQIKLGEGVDAVQAAVEASGLRNAQVLSATGLFEMNQGPTKALLVEIEVQYTD